MRTLLRYVDLPPVWLAACLGITCWLSETRPFGLAFGQDWLGLPGGLLVGAGVLLIGLAVIELRKWRTTLMPGETPSHLVQSGIYKRSRNPIYLGDLLILGGMVLYWDAPLALPLVPLLFWVLETRFVIPEENRMRREFRQMFFSYTTKTNRWWGAASAA